MFESDIAKSPAGFQLVMMVGEQACVAVSGVVTALFLSMRFVNLIVTFALAGIIMLAI